MPDKQTGGTNSDEQDKNLDMLPEDLEEDAPASNETPRGRFLMALSLTTLGVVFGDIGTSPLYALRGAFDGDFGVPLNAENILGVLSLIFWSLTIIITLKYLLYVMRADNHGEGGILALMALAVRGIDASKRSTLFLVMIGLVGAALLYGDGMITPAISVLGAVEGLDVISPTLTHYIGPITIVILIALFLFQKRGTEGVGRVFGPVMMVWFVILAALGIGQIVQRPEILRAVNPVYAFDFLFHNTIHGYLALGAVFLVVTGGEALYADMGHFGIRPIRLTWFGLVLPALLLNYFGQGALLMGNRDAMVNPFYHMAPDWALIPLLLIATFATIIASQAVISGAFSLTRQATMLGYWPRIMIQHTSEKMIGQIYIPSINWILMIAAIGLVLGFKSSANLAGAYGIAVTTTMVITTVLAYIVARNRWGWGLPAALSLSIGFLIVDLAFFGANMVKIVNGGWFPLLVAGLVFLYMSTWKRGRALLAKQNAKGMVPLEDFMKMMKENPVTRVPGAALYMTSNVEGVPQALVMNLLHNRTVHKEVILLTIVTVQEPRVRSRDRVEVKELPGGFVRIIARYGFNQHPNVLRLIGRKDTPTPPIEETTFFLGRERIVVRGKKGMSSWRTRLFAFMDRNALGATTFFHVPPDRVMEVGAQVEI